MDALRNYARRIDAWAETHQGFCLTRPESEADPDLIGLYQVPGSQFRMTAPATMAAPQQTPCRACEKMLLQQWLHVHKSGLSALPSLIGADPEVQKRPRPVIQPLMINGREMGKPGQDYGLDFAQGFCGNVCHVISTGWETLASCCKMEPFCGSKSAGSSFAN